MQSGFEWEKAGITIDEKILRKNVQFLTTWQKFCKMNTSKTPNTYHYSGFNLSLQWKVVKPLQRTGIDWSFSIMPVMLNHYRFFFAIFIGGLGVSWFWILAKPRQANAKLQHRSGFRVPIKTDCEISKEWIAARVTCSF